MLTRLSAWLHGLRRGHQVAMRSRALGLPPNVWIDCYDCHGCGKQWML